MAGCCVDSLGGTRRLVSFEMGRTIEVMWGEGAGVTAFLPFIKCGQRSRPIALLFSGLFLYGLVTLFRKPRAAQAYKACVTIRHAAGPSGLA